MAEKLGVGLLLASVAQGIFAEELTPQMFTIGVTTIAVALIFVVIAIYLSKED